MQRVMAVGPSLVGDFMLRSFDATIALRYTLSSSELCGGVQSVVTGGVAKGWTNWWHNEVGLHTAEYGTLKGYTPLWLLQMGCWTLKPLSAASPPTPQFYTNTDAACTVLPTFCMFILSIILYLQCHSYGSTLYRTTQCFVILLAYLGKCAFMLIRTPFV
jgi:hypothetical protein